MNQKFTVIIALLVSTSTYSMNNQLIQASKKITSIIAQQSLKKQPQPLFFEANTSTLSFADNTYKNNNDNHNHDQTSNSNNKARYALLGSTALASYCILQQFGDNKVIFAAESDQDQTLNMKQVVDNIVKSGDKEQIIKTLRTLKRNRKYKKLIQKLESAYMKIKLADMKYKLASSYTTLCDFRWSRAREKHKSLLKELRKAVLEEYNPDKNQSQALLNLYAEYTNKCRSYGSHYTNNEINYKCKYLIDSVHFILKNTNITQINRTQFCNLTLEGKNLAVKYQLYQPDCLDLVVNSHARSFLIKCGAYNSCKSAQGLFKALEYSTMDPICESSVAFVDWVSLTRNRDIPDLTPLINKIQKKTKTNNVKKMLSGLYSLQTLHLLQNPQTSPKQPPKHKETAKASSLPTTKAPAAPQPAPPNRLIEHTDNKKKTDNNDKSNDKDSCLCIADWCFYCDKK